jgi:RNA polymerase sigma-70 factor (ECF subfamily)
MIWQAAARWDEPMAVDSEAVRLRRGDPEVLVSLLERYQHRLYRFLMRMVHDPATAEDLFQQTWLRVAENARKYDASRPLEPWLFSIARNAAIDYLRRARPESLDEELPSGDAKVDMIAGAQVNVVDAMIGQQRSRRLADALGELTPMYCEVVTLRFEEEMKMEEIAEVLGIPVSTVKTRLRRALDALRGKLEHRLPGGELPGWGPQ